ncbi:TetR/AcrR family transcriptional regulator [Mumia zhuanghuii]|uniref:TetR/AcrR family transcriptional regulator n=2 Tax=Mumia TaxID=1546255 RepID=A0ABW1QL63_9ACTN|nr:MULTISPECIES: TetR/AcrR family transcriptional regulator [Mumia]KAA1418235.1 TetR/AcrR family transcriptional regulator [Mumia zhuanghuii]
MATHPAPPRRDRLPRVPADQRRAEILAAALEVFGSRGYHKGGLTEIAERVGITHQGVLHHFGSKEQLLVEVLAYRDALDVQEYENQQPPYGPDLLRHLVDTARRNTQRKGLVQSYAVLSAESVTEGHPAQGSFRDRFTQLRELTADALRASCPVDAMPSDKEIDAAASSILALMDGLQVQWLLDPDKVDMPYAVGLVIDALLERVGSPSRIDNDL